MIRKLKLESLHVESFQTTAAAPGLRGTVQAHAEAEPVTGTRCDTYETCNVDTREPYCGGGPTEVSYCTERCTHYESCGVDSCWVDQTTNCTA
jgi:hypothetical protein